MTSRKKRVVYQIPGMEAVTIRRDVEYRAADAGGLTLDIYYPPEMHDSETSREIIRQILAFMRFHLLA